MAIQEIVIINKSERFAGGTFSVLVMMAQACQRQVRRHIAPAWGRVPVPVYYCADEATAPPQSNRIYVLDHSDQADALGYHTETAQGLAFGRVFVQPVLANGGTVMEGSNSISATLSHEVAELFVDPDCNLWADGPKGVQYSVEVCDPVEGDAYPINIGGHPVSMSNFVTPEWFDVNATGCRYDYLSKLAAPFTMTTNGYWVVRDAEGEHAAFADRAVYPAWKLPGKLSASARTRKRGVMSI